MCVMVHQDKENDIEAAGRKWKIRNRTSIFLCLQRMQEKVHNHDVWLTQKAIAQLFDVDRSVATKQLKIYLKVGNDWKNQLVQILHKLQITERHIHINFIPCLPLLR